MMNIQLEAVYENGVFRPLQPVRLAEHQRVTLTIDAEGVGCGEGFDQAHFVLPPARWQAFCDLLDAPAREIPALRKLLTMSDITMSQELAQTPTRPFPWFCPHCRRQEVRRETIPYQCQRVHQGLTITVLVPALAVPRCGNCGELVFDFVAESQINQAYQAHVAAFGNGQHETNNPAQAGV